MDEINALHIEGMPKVKKLNALVGGYINLEYRLPNGNDGATYLGNQLECEFDGSKCFGISGIWNSFWYASMKKTVPIHSLCFIRRDKLKVRFHAGNNRKTHIKRR